MKYRVVKFETGDEALLPEFMEIKYTMPDGRGKRKPVAEVETVYLDDVPDDEIQKVITDPKGMAIDLRSRKAVKKNGKMKVFNYEQAKSKKERSASPKRRISNERHEKEVISKKSQ